MRVAFIYFSELWRKYILDTFIDVFGSKIYHYGKEGETKWMWEGFPTSVEFDFVDGNCLELASYRDKIGCFDRAYIQSDMDDMDSLAEWNNIIADVRKICKEFCFVREWEEIAEDGVEWIPAQGI